MNFTESIIEEAALAWLEGLWATPCDGSEIVPDMPGR